MKGRIKSKERLSHVPFWKESRKRLRLYGLDFRIVEYKNNEKGN